AQAQESITTATASRDNPMTAEAWDVNHPVLTLLRKRRQDGSMPGERTDNAKLGLAVEGGGMRGVVSASMLTVLDDLGFSNAIDAVYAASSGAINCAYYMAGGTWYPLSIYFDDLNTQKFLNPRNIFTNKSVLNLDYAFDEVMQNIKPVDYEYILKSPIPLHIMITLVDEMETLVTERLNSVEELREALRASAWLPVALRGTTTYRGRRAIDGGVLTALPFRPAVDDGCTHVLLLTTHPMGSISGKMSMLNRYTEHHLNRIRPGLGARYLAALRQKYADQRSLASMRFPDHARNPYILDMAPLPGTIDVKRQELSTYKLFDAARSAYQVMYAALEGRQSSTVRDGLVRAVPRFAIAEKDAQDSRYIYLIDHSSKTNIPWSIARRR
ncbi:MAG: patatin-like phospholipase family protein, partial [Gammaproteobacteria bacterium]